MRRAALSEFSLAVLFVGLFVGPFVGTGCSKTPEPDSGPGPARPEISSPQGPVAEAPKPPSPSGPADVAWDAPATWQKIDNPSPMRKATYKIPRAAGDAEDAELSVSQAGGSVDMNVNRWSGQFEQKTPDVKRTQKKVGDLNVTIIEIHGTFTGSGMPGGPKAPAKEKYALLGAIVETAQPTFFKMTGPDKTVAAARADFDKFIDSLRAK
jgi:hypothetical protein